jgi:valyl-tRNA synthetase
VRARRRHLAALREHHRERRVSGGVIGHERERAAMALRGLQEIARELRDRPEHDPRVGVVSSAEVRQRVRSCAREIAFDARAWPARARRPRVRASRERAPMRRALASLRVLRPRMTSLPAQYLPEEAESRWYARWVEAGVFRPDMDAARAGKKAYVVMMPPPNVTGSLHMGHALFVTLQDVLSRTHRMRGEPTLWLPGVDHAGIATQAVVERELKRLEGKTRHDLGREAFLERVWAWKHKNGDRIVEQLKAMGASADWSRERFTMDATCNDAVTEAFVRLWEQGLVYRGERLVHWDPQLLTSVSDEEVDYEEKEGELWRFAYPLANGTGEIVVATTRPETMLGDVAVAVHPDDERYQAMVGELLRHPFFPERRVVVVADAYVDRSFGTGAVKITPAHDPNDFELGNRHALPRINVLTLEARINDHGGRFAGLDRYEARKAVKAALEELGLARGAEKIKHNVSVSQRSGVVIEPMLSRQFFVKTSGFAEEALALVAGEQPATRILPEHWKKTWDHFMTNIRDWCVSRQLWWGHRIPVYYDTSKLDEVIDADRAKQGRDTEASRARAAGVSGQKLLEVVLRTCDDALVMRSLAVASRTDLSAAGGRYVQEEDVLDTWFSSGLWPFSTLGWPRETEDLRLFYPGAVLETGSDILFFWVARMVWFGKHFLGQSPFADVFLHAIVRDANGRKMSKSEGNAIDPLDVMKGISLPDLLAKTRTYPVPEKKLAAVLKGIEKEFPEGIPAAGADGLRFTLAALSSWGRDVKLSIPRTAGYRAFLNKVWNATRFVLLKGGEEPALALEEVRDHLGTADRYVLSRLQVAIREVSEAIDGYRFDAMANAIYRFFWNELCDVYVELAKSTLEGEDARARAATKATLVHVLDTSMRLLHPLCPFLTEEIWQLLPGRSERWPSTAFCAQASWPSVDASLYDAQAEGEIAILATVANMVRSVRQESGLPPRKGVVVDAIVPGELEQARLLEVGAALRRFASIDELRVVLRGTYSPPALAAVHASGDVEVVVHLEGLIDPAKERARLEREMAKADKDLAGLTKRFENADFIARAPADVVEQGKLDMAALTEKLLRLRQALERLG